MLSPVGQRALISSGHAPTAAASEEALAAALTDAAEWEAKYRAACTERDTLASQVNKLLTHTEFLIGENDALQARLGEAEAGTYPARTVSGE